MNTVATKAKDISHLWHLVDVKDKTLGREATHIALLLMGKSKPYFVRNLDCGDYVVVVNAKEIQVTGRKATEKMYANYSGYPGGLKKESFRDLRERRPQEVVKHAVYGMLPKNKLRDKLVKRLYIYSDNQHPYSTKFQK